MKSVMGLKILLVDDEPDIVEVIQDRNLMAGGEEFLDEMRSNESGAARHENFHGASVRRKRWPGKERTDGR